MDLRAEERAGAPAPSWRTAQRDLRGRADGAEARPFPVARPALARLASFLGKAISAGLKCQRTEEEKLKSGSRSWKDRWIKAHQSDRGLPAEFADPEGAGGRGQSG